MSAAFRKDATEGQKALTIVALAEAEASLRRAARIGALLRSRVDGVHRLADRIKELRERLEYERDGSWL